MAYFEELFLYDLENPAGYRYGYTVAELYSRPEEYQMRYFFYQGLGDEKAEPITDAEMQYLHDNGYEFWWASETHRLPADQAAQLVWDYFGLTLDQANFSLPYNPTTDCYYIFHADSTHIVLDFLKGYYNAQTGITTLYYPSPFTSDGLCVITLADCENPDVPYRVMSHELIPA